MRASRANLPDQALVAPAIHTAAALRFQDGLLRYTGESIPEGLASFFRRSPHGGLIAPAHRYSEILAEAVALGIPVVDQAARFDTVGETIEREVLSVYNRVVVQCRSTREEVRTYYVLRKPMDDLWLSARDAHRVQGSDWFLRERRIRPDAVSLALRSVLRWSVRVVRG